MGVLGFTWRQRQKLEQIMKHPPSGRQLKRAQALVWVDEGEDISAVAQRLRISRQIVHQWIRRAQQDAEWISHQLGDARRSGRPACKAALVDETIPGCLKSDPQARGYQVNGWTNGLLRREVQRQHQVWVCPQTMRAGIQRAGYRWKRPRYVLARRPPTWRQAKGGLKRGLPGRERTVILMSDATIVTETPPLRAAYAPLGDQAEVPITGNHSTRAVFGMLNVHTGHLELWIMSHWDALCWQLFLRHTRSVWRGWHMVLFLDRGSPHTAEVSQELADQVGIELRWLPTATPELNALEGLWREGKDQVLANHPPRTVDESAMALCQYLLGLTPQQCLQKAGVLSGHFWLTI